MGWGYGAKRGGVLGGGGGMALKGTCISCVQCRLLPPPATRRSRTQTTFCICAVVCARRYYTERRDADWWEWGEDTVASRSIRNLALSLS